MVCCCSVAQSCPTSCDPVDCSPPGPTVHGFPGKGTGAGRRSLPQGTFLARGQTRASRAAGRLLTAEPPGEPQCQSRFPRPLLGAPPNPGVKPRSPTLQADSLPPEQPGKPRNTGAGSPESSVQPIAHHLSFFFFLFNFCIEITTTIECKIINGQLAK